MTEKNELQQQLQNILLQKESLKLQQMEIEHTLKELQKVKEDFAYKIVGNVMIKKSKDEIEKSLNEGLENIKIRIESLEKIEKKLTDKIKGGKSG